MERGTRGRTVCTHHADWTGDPQAEREDKTTTSLQVLTMGSMGEQVWEDAEATFVLKMLPSREHTDAEVP